MECYGNKIDSYFLILFLNGGFPSKLDGIKIAGPTQYYRGHRGSHAKNSVAQLLCLSWENLPYFQ